MELNSDIVAVQGILTSVVKKTGEFGKIHYRGGNEEKILDVIVELLNFFKSKHYIIKDEINVAFKNELYNIVLFLAINTNYNKPSSELEEFSHVMNIVPQLSKCLFINTVFGLNLCKICCEVFEVLPIELTIELLDETVTCLKKSEPKVRLENSYWLLQSSASKISHIENSNKNEDSIDRFVEVTNIILQDLTGLYKTDNCNTRKIYQHMGYSLLRLFELLLFCDQNNHNLDKFIENILRTCCSVVKCVTIKVFCTWVEIEEDDQPLQNVIGEKAYLVLEKYNKHKVAKELISMIGTMARKPKTLVEQIKEANMDKIIKQLNKGGDHQKRWFQALLNMDVLKDCKAIECIDRWSALCDDEDVVRLLNLSAHSKDVRTKKLAVKCATALSLDKLIQVTTRHFYSNGFTSVLNEHVEGQMLLIFNKINDSHKDTFDIVLLLLQNPNVVLKYIYSECLKQHVYASYLNDVFVNIKQIAQIEGIGVKILNETIQYCQPNVQNVENYIALFSTLLKTGYCSNDVLLLKVLMPFLQVTYKKENSYEELYYILRIFNEIQIKLVLKEDTKTVINLLFSIMKDCRCTFLEFDGVKMNIVGEVVQLLMNIDRFYSESIGFDESIEPVGDAFVEYYKEYLSSTNTSSNLLNNLCGDTFENITRYAECVSKLIEVLPLCVTPEWLCIGKEIVKICGAEKQVELLTDMMFLLAQCVISQENSSSNSELCQNLYNALKFCIQHFGMLLQDLLQSESTVNHEIIVAKHLCRLLRKLPKQVLEDVGLSLVNLLTNRSLKSLVDDKEFVCSVVLIKNPQICKILAQKIMGKT